jgi:predicted CoA-substrate-specific enzyme activase
MICAGVDAGSRTIKIALVDGSNDQLLGSGVVDQGVEQNALAQQLLEKVLAEIGATPDDLALVVATGYGRKLIRDAHQAVTEITCQGAGTVRYWPQARTVIDIGGQDSKLLRLDGQGRVTDFVMNDRCAAGTGRFLEVVATQLGIRLAELGEMAHHSRQPALISSMCVVFAETEIVGLLAQGTEVHDIAAGVQASVASRVASMAGQQVQQPVVFTGGVALIPSMASALSTAFDCPVSVAHDPQLTCALGAALLAARQHRKTLPP